MRLCLEGCRVGDRACRIDIGLCKIDVQSMTGRCCERCCELLLTLFRLLVVAHWYRCIRGL